MIVTLTANPSLDRTVGLDGPLVRGSVHRAVTCTDEPGGKGVNVVRAMAATGRPALAVLPARREDPLLVQMRGLGVPHHAVHTDDLVRVNLTVTEPDGTTSKLNLPGHPLSEQVRDELVSVLLKEAAGARWAVLSGSLPPGAGTGWYASLVRLLRQQQCRVAVDTSGAPLRAVLDGDPDVRPDLLKPNREELAEALSLEPGRIDGGPRTVATLARRLLRQDTGAVLVTLGADGAVLVTGEGAWHAVPPPITARSTVGAGDATLAGYLLADLDDAAPAERLRRAVAYGSAAAGLPGSAMPEPTRVRPTTVTVTPIPS